MSQQNILRKIRGLLAKADGTDNELEGETFLQAAQRLMLKYQVGEAELIASGAKIANPTEGKVIHFPQSVGRSDKIYLLRVLVRSVHGRVVDSPPNSFYLIGDPIEMLTCEALWTSLCLQLDTQTARYVRENRGAGVHARTLRSSFIIGWADHVALRLEELRKAEPEAAGGTSLVLISKQVSVDDWLAKNLKTEHKGPKKRSVHPASMKQGEARGNAADIGQTKVSRPQQRSIE